MSNFTVRDLLPRIVAMRPDVDPGLIERLTQEAAKRVLRESFLGQVVSTVFWLPAGTNQIMLCSQLPYWASGQPNMAIVETNKVVYPTTWDGSTPDSLSGVDPNPNQKTPAEVLRVLEVRTIQPPIFSTAFFRGWLIGIQTSLPAASTIAAGGFFICYGTGPFVVNGNTVYNQTGDIWQSDGTQWNLTTLEYYNTINQVNLQTVRKTTNQPKVG